MKLNLQELLDDVDVKITKRDSWCPSLFDITFLILFVCKVLGVITWSWWAVFAPLLIEFGLFIFLILVLVIIFLLVKDEDEKGNDDLE